MSDPVFGSGSVRGLDALTVADARGRLLSALRDARQRFARARAPLGAVTGLRRGAAVVLLGAILFAAFRLAAWLLAADPLDAATPWVFFGALALVPLAGLLGWLAARARPPSLAATAEILDRDARSDGRVAGALSLSGGAIGPFEAAAIVDGLQALEPALRAPPAPAAARIPNLVPVQVSAALALIVLAGLVPRRLVPSVEREPATAIAEAQRRNDPLARAAAPRPEPAPAPAPPPERAAERPPSASPEKRSVTGKSSAPEPGGDRQKSSGRPGPGRDVEARKSREASVAQGDPTEGAATPPLDDQPKAAKKPAKKEPDRARIVPPKRDREEKMGATAGQAGAGGGAMSPVKSPWTQRDRSADDPMPENPADEEIQDEAQEEDARGGTQPTLKDRRGSTSRDLTISGAGEGGEGRGGPTPQKKARGTASLVLGVPVPDFVRGLLNPGTTKVTHERVEPVPSDAEAHERVALAARRRPEPPLTGDRAPAGFEAAVRRFFLALHRAEARPGS